MIMLMALGACDDSSEGGGGVASGGEDGPFTESKLTFACPRSLAAGVADTLTGTIQNPGDEDWPVTRIGWDGSVDTIVDSITLDGKDPGSGGGPISYGDPPDPTSRDAPTFDVAAFPSLGAGETAKLQVKVKPKRAGNTELQFVIWGESKNIRGALKIPPDVPLQGCDNIPVKR
jgi:hypothetical protein